MNFIKGAIGFAAGGFVSLIFIVTIDMLFGSNLSGGTGSNIFIVFFAFVFAGMAIDNFGKVIGTSVVLFIFLALIKDIDINNEKIVEPINQSVKIEKSLEQTNSTITVVSINQDLLPGDTYLEKIGYLILGMFFAFVLGLFKPFQNDKLQGSLFIISVPVSGYYVYTIEGLSFMSLIYTIGFCIYAILTIAILAIDTPTDVEIETKTYPTPEPTPIPEPDPIPTPEPIIEEPKDIYVTCVNCNTKHKNPENDLCNKCTKNMHKLDTNIKCSNCGGEYESDEISCPYCGQN